MQTLPTAVELKRIPIRNAFDRWFITVAVTAFDETARHELNLSGIDKEFTIRTLAGYVSRTGSKLCPFWARFRRVEDQWIYEDCGPIRPPLGRSSGKPELARWQWRVAPEERAIGRYWTEEYWGRKDRV